MILDVAAGKYAGHAACHQASNSSQVGRSCGSSCVGVIGGLRQSAETRWVRKLSGDRLHPIFMVMFDGKMSCSTVLNWL